METKSQSTNLGSGGSAISKTQSSHSTSRSINSKLNFSIFWGFSDKELEKKYSIPLISDLRLMVFCIPFVYILLFGLSFFMSGPDVVIKKLMDIDYTFIELIQNENEFFHKFLEFVVFGICTLLSFVLWVIAIFLYVSQKCCKKKINYLIVLFMENFANIVLLVALTVHSIHDYKDDVVNPLNATVATIKTFLFGMIPLRYRFTYVIWLDFISVFLVFAFQAYYFSDFLFPIFQYVQFIILWMLILVVKGIEEYGSRKNFAMKIEEELKRQYLKNVVKEISSQTTTIIPLKRFQNLIIDNYNSISSKTNKTTLSISSQRQHFNRTMLIQVDLVDFTEFCSGYIQQSNPIIVAVTLERVFSIFDKILHNSNFVCANLIGDAYIALYRKNIILPDDAENKFNPKSDVRLADQEFNLTIDTAIQYCQTMITRTKKMYEPGLRIGLCIEECSAHIFPVLNGFRFDIYGKAVQLVDYLQKLAPIGGILACKKVQNRMKSSYLKFIEKTKSSSIVKKKIEEPYFYRNEKMFMVSGIKSDHTNENEILKRIKSKPESMSNSQLSDSAMWLSSSYKKAFGEKKSLGGMGFCFINFFKKFFDIFVLVDFYNNYRANNYNDDSNDDEDKPIMVKERFNICKQISRSSVGYLSFTARLKFQTSFYFGILQIIFALFSPIVYYVGGNHLDILYEGITSPTKLPFFLIYCVIIIVSIFFQLLYFVEYYLYKKGKVAFYYLFYFNDFVKFILLASSILYFETVGDANYYFNNLNYFLLLLIMYCCAFSVLKVFSLIATVILFITYMIFTNLSVFGDELEVVQIIAKIAFTGVFTLLSSIFYFYLNSQTVESYLQYYVGTLRNNILRKKINQKKEYSLYLMKQILPNGNVLSKFLKKKEKNLIYAKSCIGYIGRIDAYPLSSSKEEENNDSWKEDPNVMTNINELFEEMKSHCKKFNLFRVKVFGNSLLFIEKKSNSIEEYNSFEKCVLYSLKCKIIANKNYNLGVSIGISFGSYVRGVINGVKIMYDVLGDCVNRCSRYSMNQKGNLIQTEISHGSKIEKCNLYKVVKADVKSRGELKGLNEIETCFITSEMDEKRISQRLDDLTESSF